MFIAITRIIVLTALLSLPPVLVPPSAWAGCRYLSRGIQLCCTRLDSGKTRCCYVFTATGRVVCSTR